MSGNLCEKCEVCKVCMEIRATQSEETLSESGVSEELRLSLAEV